MYAGFLEAKNELLTFAKNGGNNKQSKLLQSPLEIFIGVGFPTLIVYLIIRMYISKLRYKYAVFVVVVFTVIPVLLTVMWTRHEYKAIRQGRARRAWLAMCGMTWFAVIFGCLKGDTTFWRYSRSYYQFEDLASYVNISPSNDRGQSYMDAGQVYFKEGSRVETSKAMAFQEDQVYCVAPIVQETLDGKGQEQTAGGNMGKGGLKLPASGTVDFWAVGMNCCDPSGLNFKCGDAENVNARAGIRVLRDDTRPFFLMAVQEWTAWLQMPAKHPLFFHWVQDPLLQVDKLWYEAWLHMMLDTFLAFVICCVGTISLHVLFYNMGF
jgi:hypothetical protein